MSNPASIKAGCTFVFKPSYTAGLAEQQLASKVENATRIYFNDFKMRIAAPMGLPPTVVKINFREPGLLPTETNLGDQFVVFPQWDPVTRSLRETWSSPGFVLAERFNAETPFRGLSLLFTDENDIPIPFELCALRLTVEYATEPNNRYNNNHTYQTASMLPLSWTGKSYSPQTY